ncbi:hypothetical protein [Erythrobacter sp.]|uniref:hypothetical protein n=1 Tax=Erythrobacter sp. TaxID=1042 RepID=UPI0025D20C8D|nr:hypothetical protein [Erythrobacter sp.]
MADFSRRRQLPDVRLMVTEPASQLLRVSRQQPTFRNRPHCGHSLPILALGFKLRPMWERAMRLAWALVGVGILLAVPLSYFGYEVWAGGAFIAGMVLAWIASAVIFARKLWSQT